jgi:hypothetical protein
MAKNESAREKLRISLAEIKEDSSAGGLNKTFLQTAHRGKIRAISSANGTETRES